MSAGVRRLITSVFGGVALSLALAAGACAAPSPLELASPASPNTHALADIYWVVFVIVFALFALVVVGIGLAVVRGRLAAGRGADVVEAAPSRLGGARLVALIAIPVVALAVVAGVVFVKQGAARNAPAAGAAGTVAVTVVGTSSGWTYTYANGATSDDLRIPTGAVIRLTITAADVQHSWWVPSLAGQVRVFPGEPAQLSFRSDRDGTYAGRSTVAQGATATPEIAVVSLPQSEFDDWVGKAATAKGGS